MTQRPWRLTTLAARSLVGISRWTLETFGPRQAEAYEADLLDACRSIASGDAASMSCQALVEGLVSEDLRFLRSGQHFIVFIEGETEYVVVDFLHARSNLDRHVSALLARDDEQDSR